MFANRRGMAAVAKLSPQVASAPTHDEQATAQAEVPKVSAILAHPLCWVGHLLHTVVRHPEEDARDRELSKGRLKGSTRRPMSPR